VLKNVLVKHFVVIWVKKEGIPSIAVRIGAFQSPSSAKSKDSIYMMDA
jgi:hypothetical protein